MDQRKKAWSLMRALAERDMPPSYSANSRMTLFIGHQRAQRRTRKP